MNQRPHQFAVVGATLLDGNGGVPVKNAYIKVVEKRIVEVGAGSADLPPDTEIIDATGKFVIPGLMDANVHLYFGMTAPELMRFHDNYEVVIEEAAQICLRNGLTTVFDTWGPISSLQKVRNNINQGQLVGSRIYCGGNIIGFGGPTSADFYPDLRKELDESHSRIIDERWEQGVGEDLLWLSADNLRAKIREYIANARPDFLKYGGSGHIHMQFIAFSPDSQRVIVEEGHRAGLTVQAHTTSPESLKMEIVAGADLLQHADVTGAQEMPDRTLNEIVGRKIPAAALFSTRRFLRWNDEKGTEPMKTIHRVKDENDKRLVQAGATILLATDSVIISKDAATLPALKNFASADAAPTTLGEGHFLWLEAAQELKMNPMGALMAATRNIARAYRFDDDIGTVEAGKFADLLILDADPLADAGNYRKINRIIKDGLAIDRESLPQRRILSS